MSWGSQDENGTFNGVVGRVGYGQADLGVSSLGYRADRQTVVDYSHVFLSIGMNWISKPPGKLSAAKNLSR